MQTPHVDSSNPSSSIINPDKILASSMSMFVRLSAARASVPFGRRRWRPNEPLKLLLIGYNGVRNTGADVRVQEMVRQFQSICPPGTLELTVMTYDERLSAGYFAGAEQLLSPLIFPRFFYEHCRRYDGIVACEGNTFQSHFSNALSLAMGGALGLAASEGKLGVAYGAEAGNMDPLLRDFVARNCKGSLAICRNEESLPVLSDLGMRTARGTDTAWTFDPQERGNGTRLLRDAGWDGRAKVLAICPINPFWWPVRPDLARALRHAINKDDEGHYKSVYFHHYPPSAKIRFDGYIRAIAQAVRAFSKEHDVFPILVGMERIDRKACEQLASIMDRRPPIFVSDELDMFDLVGVLRASSLLLSSRFHAIVTSMPSAVPSAGVTMDHRISNLMRERGHSHLCAGVEDSDLEERILVMLRELVTERERLGADIERCVAAQVQLQGRMGRLMRDELTRVYPEFPAPEPTAGWEQYLPKLSPTTESLLRRRL